MPAVTSPTDFYPSHHPTHTHSLRSLLEQRRGSSGLGGGHLPCRSPTSLIGFSQARAPPLSHGSTPSNISSTPAASMPTWTRRSRLKGGPTMQLTLPGHTSGDIDASIHDAAAGEVAPSFSSASGATGSEGDMTACNPPELQCEPPTPLASVLTFAQAGTSPAPALMARRRPSKGLFLEAPSSPLEERSSPTMENLSSSFEATEHFAGLSIDTTALPDFSDADFSLSEIGSPSPSGRSNRSTSFSSSNMDDAQCAAGIPRSNKKSHAKKRPDGHVKRPRNAFILFRSHAIQQGLIPKTVENHQKNVSNIVSQLWHNLSDEERAKWQRNAAAEKAEHLRLYPEYSYRPPLLDHAKKRKATRDRSNTVQKRSETLADEILRSLGRDGLRKEAAEERRALTRRRREKLAREMDQEMSSSSSVGPSSVYGGDDGQSPLSDADSLFGAHRRTTSLPVSQGPEAAAMLQVNSHASISSSPGDGLNPWDADFMRHFSSPLHSDEPQFANQHEYSASAPAYGHARPHTSAGFQHVSNDLFASHDAMPISPRTGGFGDFVMPGSVAAPTMPSMARSYSTNSPALVHASIPHGMPIASGLPHFGPPPAPPQAPATATRRLSAFLMEAAGQAVARDQALGSLTTPIEENHLIDPMHTFEEVRDTRIRQWRASISERIEASGGQVSITDIIGTDSSTAQSSIFGMNSPGDLDLNNIDSALLEASFSAAINSSSLPF